MTRRREALLAFASTLVGVALFLVTAEVALRFLPVASGMRTVAVTADQPVMHFTPDRAFVYSNGWDLAMVNRGRVNNAGFVNDQDYRKDDPRPLLAVIGDSYVEAAMVPYAETMHGRLARALDGRLRVYSFGASGAPLSQYLIWARHAVREYGARALVVNVVGNDFDESLAAYKSGPGFWLYQPQADASLALRLQEYRPGALREVAYRSALSRYMLFNLGVGPHLLNPRIDLGAFLDMLSPRGAPAPAASSPAPYAGNTAAEATPARVSDSLAAVEAFFRDLPGMTGLPPDRIAFTVDGFRYADAAGSSAGTYFDRMRRAFIARAASAGYEAIDLDPLFIARHRKTGERFDYPRDGHWNPAGHEVAAGAVMASRLVSRLQP